MVSLRCLNVACYCAIPALISAHSWPECFSVKLLELIKYSKEFIYGASKTGDHCQGYPIKYPTRADPDVATKAVNKIYKNDVEQGAPLCLDSQTSEESAGGKILRVEPGQTAYYAYMENGHIAKDKKGIGTMMGVYSSFKAGQKLNTTRDILPQYLFPDSYLDFDDGKCGETTDAHGNPSGRAGDGVPCIARFSVPNQMLPGRYFAVWFWKMYHDNPSEYADPELAKGYYGAAYATCFYIDVVAKSDEAIKNLSTNEELWISFSKDGLASEVNTVVAPASISVSAQVPTLSSESAKPQPLKIRQDLPAASPTVAKASIPDEAPKEAKEVPVASGTKCIVHSDI